MKNYGIITITILVLYSCTNNSKQISTADNIYKIKTDSFFPVTSFIKGQLITLDSLPVTPLQLTTIKGKTDSVWLTKDGLMPMLLPYLIPVISETNFTKYFKETIFNDQTLNAVTFTYDPVSILPDSITLRHWDVYVNPESGNVIKVYIVKKLKENNQIFTQQLTWQTNKRAKITTILDRPDGSMELLKEVVYIWDFTPIH